jgi:uncharacterized protein (TIGR04255 family)
MSNDLSSSDWRSRRTPEYKNPPVVETALAIEFAPIKGWNLVQYGALWERFKTRYPKVEVNPAPQEFFTCPQLDFADPPVRCFFIAATDNQLVQIRSGAFVRNWRASQENPEYSRYETIRPSFQEDLGLFLDFLTEQGLDRPEVWKCEVTYVNHFLRGREWQEPSEMWKVLPAFATPVNSEVLSNLQNQSLAQNFALPDEIGQIQFQLQQGIRNDGLEIFQLSITAFGKPRGSGIEEILEWLDLGHFAVVQGFTDFTSPQVQESVWERTWP